MKKLVKSTSAVTASADVSWLSSVDDVRSSTDFPVPVVDDLESVMNDFSYRIDNVVECVRENFGTSPDYPVMEAFAVGPDNINVQMSASMFRYTVGQIVAKYLESELDKWMGRSARAVHSDEYTVYKDLERQSTDAKASCTLSME